MRSHITHIGFFALRLMALNTLASGVLVVLLFGLNDSAIAQARMELIALAIIVPLIAVATHQVLAYETDLPCMSGMMVGMTIGMIAGFLIGYLVGATNGMFVGSVVGAGAGIAVGVASGRCCGIMGVLEGMMAGLMAGAMGAMLAVMMLVDRYRVFTILFIGLCIIILGALSVMVEREFLALKKPRSAEVISRRWRQLFATTVLATVLIAIVMLAGPRGPLTIFSGI